MMAGKNISTPPGTNTEKPLVEPSENSDQEMSEEDLNLAISEVDPEFFKLLDEIYNDTSLSISQFVLAEGMQVLRDEKAAWASSRGMKKWVYRIFPLAPYLSFFFKKIKLMIFDFLRAQWVRIKNFAYFLATNGKTKIYGKAKDFLGRQSEKLSESQRNFRYLNWKLKMAFFAILLLMAGTGFFIYRSLTHGVIFESAGPFILSLESVASQVYEYDPKTDLEPFYENLRVSTNIIQMPKMVVNLKKSAHSRDNPMGAFEFYLEGLVPEVTVEIKEREVEIRDRMQRVIEDFSFDQVESPEGKKLLVDKLKKEINLKMTTGKLKKVWIKTVIVKP